MDVLSAVIVHVNNEKLVLRKTEEESCVPTKSLGQLSFEEAAILSIKNTGLDAKPLGHRRPQDIVVIVGEEERRTELELFRAYKDKGQMIAAYSVIIFSDKEAVNQSLNSNFELVTKEGLEKRSDIEPLNGQLVRDYLTTVYRQPTPTVDIIIEYIHKCETYVILIERGEYPFGDALPGGFAEPWKTYEETAIDEAEQETGLKVELVGTLGAYSDPDRDPYRKEKNTASVCYVAKVVEGTLRAGDDAKGVRLVKCSDLQRFLNEDKQIPTYHYIAAGRELEEGEPLERILFDHPQMLRDYFAGRVLPMK